MVLETENSILALEGRRRMPRLLGPKRCLLELARESWVHVNSTARPSGKRRASETAGENLESPPLQEIVALAHPIDSKKPLGL